MIFAWNSSLETGIKKIDAQHWQLLSLINDLHDACENDNDVEMLQGALAYMVEYAVQHFRDEEAVQLAAGYPGYEQHKLEHDIFKGKVADLVRQFEENGSSAELSLQINQFLAKWFLRHIRQVDMVMGKYIQGNNAQE